MQVIRKWTGKHEEFDIPRNGSKVLGLGLDDLQELGGWESREMLMRYAHLDAGGSMLHGARPCLPAPGLSDGDRQFHARFLAVSSDHVLAGSLYSTGPLPRIGSVR